MCSGNKNKRHEWIVSNFLHIRTTSKLSKSTFSFLKVYHRDKLFLLGILFVLSILYIKVFITDSSIVWGGWYKHPGFIFHRVNIIEIKDPFTFRVWLLILCWQLFQKILPHSGPTWNFNLSLNLACLEHASWATNWLDYWGEIHPPTTLPNLKFVKMTLKKG